MKTAYIEPGSAWENDYCESCNARFPDVCLNGEIFLYREKRHRSSLNSGGGTTTRQDRISALGYRPPAPAAIVPVDDNIPMLEHSNWASQRGRVNCLTSIFTQ
jgi:hypothetical protein